MTNFEKITEMPESLGEFLASLPVAIGPWDAATSAPTACILPIRTA